MRTIESIAMAIMKRCWRIVVPWRLKRRGVNCGVNSVFYGMPLVSLAPNSTISLGERVVLTSHGYFTALGVARPCTLRTMRPNAEITIGNDTGLSGVVICSADSVQIGKECLIGADVFIVDTNFHPINSTARRFAKIEDAQFSKVVIENNVFIGARSTILKGVTIGENSIIGAGSLVTSNIPANVIAAGVPARVLRKIQNTI